MVADDRNGFCWWTCGRLRGAEWQLPSFIKPKKVILITWSMKIVFQLILFALITATAFSQTVSGIVRDDKGNPMPNASVLIKDKKGGTVCNVEGKYFLNLSPGKYTLIAQHVGYKRDMRNITVED